FAKGGAYDVKLTVVDRAGHTMAVSHQVTVLPLPTTGGGTVVGSGAPAVLHARVQLLPQALRSVLKSGVAVRVSSNLAADGFTSLSIPSKYARQAKLRGIHGSTMTIGRGTLSGVVKGTKVVHVRIPAAT